MDSFTFDAVIIAAVLLLTVASMGGWFGEPTRRAYIAGMADKPDLENPADQYSEEETDRRMDATVRAMIGMKPKPHQPLTPKTKTRPASKGRVRKGKARN